MDNYPTISIILVSDRVSQSISKCINSPEVQSPIPKEWFNWNLEVPGLGNIQRTMLLGSMGKEQEQKIFEFSQKYNWQFTVCLHVGEELSLCSHLPDAMLVYLEQDADGEWDMLQHIARPDPFIKYEWGMKRIGLSTDGYIAGGMIIHLEGGVPTRAEDQEVPEGFWTSYAMAYNNWFEVNSTKPNQESDQFTWHPAWNTWTEQMQLTTENAIYCEVNGLPGVMHKTMPYLQFGVDSSDPEKLRLRCSDPWISLKNEDWDRIKIPS
ncbi:MAG: hypothetical protein PHH70_01580 [Candidatus Gracilibacteria bacterium]|nr:hypothetical protein [Candidatus Gracilibacteria bacterium]